MTREVADSGTAWAGWESEMPHNAIVAGLAVKYSPTDGRILDMDCGTGHTLAAIRRQKLGRELHAAHVDPVCLRHAADLVPEANQHLLSSLEDFPVIDGGFDVCILSHVLEHMTNPGETIRKALAITRPGGHLVLAVPNPVRPYVFFTSMTRKAYSDIEHVYCWDRSHWINFLERIMSLDVVEYSQDYAQTFSPLFTRRFKIFGAIERGLGCIFPWLCRTNIAVIKK